MTRRSPLMRLRFDEQTLQKLRAQFREYFKNGGGVYNAVGSRLLIHKSLCELGYPLDSKYIRNVFLETANEFGLRTKSAKQHSVKAGTRPTEYDSMKLGPKAHELGWELVQQPAVYKIVCEGNGRHYIGASTRPDLRRAVHKFWIKNPWKYGVSNIFFGNKQLWRDVQKYGWEAFHCDIIHSMPTATLAELHAVEQEEIDKAGPSKLYNYSEIKSSNKHFYRFSQLNPEFKKLVKKYDVIKNTAEKLKLEWRDEIVIFNRIKAEKTDDKNERIKAQERIVKAKRKKKIAAFKEIGVTKTSILANLTELKKQFAESETPLY